MDIHTFNSIVSNQDISSFLFATERELDKKQIARHLIGIENPIKRDEYISLVINQLLHQMATSTDEPTRKTCSKVLKGFVKVFDKDHPTLSEGCTRKIQTLAPILKMYKKKGHLPQSIVSPGALSTPPACFPTYQSPLTDLLHVHASLSDHNNLLAHHLLEDMKARSILDPEMSQKHMKKHQKDPMKKQFHGSDVLFPEQDFILASRPKNLQKVSNYIANCLQKNVCLLVSLHESCEHPEKGPDFWLSPTLSQLTLPDGWKIAVESTKTLVEGHVPNKNGRLPKITETRLIATRDGEDPRILTHLHYDGWVDHNPVPDEPLLSILLDRMQQLNPYPRNPIAINCNAGVGRTGTVAASFVVRRKMDAERAQGRDISRFQINFPEIVYAFRKQRGGMVGNPLQFTQLYTIAHAYFEKSKPAQTTQHELTPIKQEETLATV